MSKNLKNFFMVFMIIGIIFTMSACNSSSEDNEQSTQTDNGLIPNEKHELAGEYEIDISNLGMALTFYLKIDDDDNFILSPSRDFSQDRGRGTIGELDGTYMMIYHDSTPEKSKTATFERDGHNLIFRSTLPYGSSNIMFEVEDEDNPSIIHRLKANKYVYEEFYDTYFGFYSENDEDYEYVLKLKSGA